MTANMIMEDIKYSKPDTERQIPHDLTPMWNLKVLISWTLKSTQVFTRGWGGQDGTFSQQVQSYRYIRGASSGVLWHCWVTIMHYLFQNS